jgi:hypothetical protein
MVLLPTRAELPVCSSSFVACSADIPGAASAGRARCGVVAAEARETCACGLPRSATDQWWDGFMVQLVDGWPPSHSTALEVYEPRALGRAGFECQPATLAPPLVAILSRANLTLDCPARRPRRGLYMPTASSWPKVSAVQVVLPPVAHNLICCPTPVMLPPGWASEHTKPPGTKSPDRATI